MKTTLVCMNWKRTNQLRKIVDQQSAYSCIDDVIIWNNNKDTRIQNWPYRVIETNQDFGLFTRFAAASLAYTESVILQDDDILVPEKTIKELIRLYKDEPGCHGLFGRPSKKGKYICREAKGSVDIVLTRCVAVGRNTCILALRERNKFLDIYKDQKLEGNGEDIILSFINRHLGYAAESHKLPYKDLNQASAICKRSGHWKTRDKIVRRCQNLYRGA